MIDKDFEQIMAYHDKELGPKASKTVEQLLLDSEQARDFLKSLQKSDNYLQQGLVDILDQPLPEPLVNSIREGQPGRKQESTVIAFPKWRSINRWTYATAASISLVVLAGTLVISNSITDISRNPFYIALNEALETTLSGDEYRDPSDQIIIAPIATINTIKAGVCRQYAGQFEGKQRVGLACREASYQWSIHTEQQIATSETTPSYVPASGDSNGISDAIKALGGNKPLNHEQEQTLILDEWNQ